MKKPRLAAIEYIRGISMLGVIGIHVGSQYLTAPNPSVELTALFEIVTRFCVPIFFFISAFGLFYNLEENFSYGRFLIRRGRTVMIPYIAWSLFYLKLDTYFYPVMFPDNESILEFLFFGVAKYQLYFLVLLIWFYLLMPLWIFIVKRLDSNRLILILILQIAFDYWSSYILPKTEFVAWIDSSYPIDSFIRRAIDWRVSYWFVHYIFIWILGGYLAIRFENFMEFMKSNKISIWIFFIATLIGMLAHYYFLIWNWEYRPEWAINIAHQLSPIGILYTISASIFCFERFTFGSLPNILRHALEIFGKHSYFAYLFHPTAIMFLLERISVGENPIEFYFATLIISILVAMIFRKIPFINFILIGARK